VNTEEEDVEEEGDVEEKGEEEEDAEGITILGPEEKEYLRKTEITDKAEYPCTNATSTAHPRNTKRHILRNTTVEERGGEG
jgi:hypothetical protein